jgi:hypothetical protein
LGSYRKALGLINPLLSGAPAAVLEWMGSSGVELLLWASSFPFKIERILYFLRITFPYIANFTRMKYISKIPPCPSY